MFKVFLIVSSNEKIFSLAKITQIGVVTWMFVSGVNTINHYLKYGLSNIVIDKTKLIVALRIWVFLFVLNDLFPKSKFCVRALWTKYAKIYEQIKN